VGNFSDESDIPGMAHAVEHVSIPIPAVLHRPC
jgi:secreted Zn-dependent insulinase-like peptidase